MDNLIAKNQLFYLVNKGLNRNIGTNAIPEFHKEDMTELFTLSCRQGVNAIVWDGIVKSGDIPLKREDKIRWALSSEETEQHYNKQKTVISQLASFYAQNGIKMMLLKGYGLSLLYPQPSHRRCSDVDIWLFGEQKRADKLLNKQFGIKIDNGHEHHTIFHYKGIMVENHYDFMNKQAHLSNRMINSYLLSFSKQESRTLEIEGQKVYLPSNNMNALFLLRHAASHFAAVGISLRHIIDWALFAESEKGNIDWEAIESIAKEQNMDRFLHCLYAICIEYLWVDPSCFPQFSIDNQIKDAVLNDILFPFFNEYESKGIIKLNLYRLRRWKANKWKHDMVYKETLWKSFITQVYGHILKPKSFLSNK